MFKLSSDNMVQYLLVGLAVVLVGYLVFNHMGQSTTQTVEGFYQDEEPAQTDEVEDNEEQVGPSEPLGENEEPKGLNQVESTEMTQLPESCYPREVNTAEDLLPNDANSKWAQASPSGTGSLSDKNYLTAGYHVGINTVGQSLRNANQQLRSEYVIPKQNVSIWNNSTIEGDTNRRDMEIGN